MQEPVRQIQLRCAEQMLEGGHDRLDLRPIRTRCERLSPRATVKELVEDFDFLFKKCQRLVERGADVLPGPVTGGVVAECGLQRLSDTDIVDDQPARLVPEGAVDPRDRLHKPRAAHRLVHVHRVHRGRVEPSQPHVSDDHQFQRVVRVLRPGFQFGQRLPAARVLREFGPVGRRTSYDDLDLANAVVVAMPVRSQLNDRVVQLRTDPPGHAHNHRLARQRTAAGLPMRHEVGGDLLDTIAGAYDGLHPRPPSPQLLPGLDLGELSDLLEAGVELRARLLRQLHLDQSGLVEHLDGGAVLDRLRQVIDVDVLPEDRPRVAVSCLDRRAGEPNERGVRKRVAQVAGQPVDQVILRAVRLVCDHNDVASVREQREPAAGLAVLLREPELLHCREHDPTGRL